MHSVDVSHRLLKKHCTNYSVSASLSDKNILQYFLKLKCYKNVYCYTMKTSNEKVFNKNTVIRTATKRTETRD